MRNTLHAVLLTTLIAAPALTAQSSPCLSMNWGGNRTLRYRTSNIVSFAIQAKNDATLRQVDGLEFYTQARSSSQTVTVGIWDAPGPMSASGKRLASGTMTMTTTLGIHKATFATPAVLAPNATFWITFDRASFIYMPTVLPGTSQTHYWYNGSRWSGPYTGTWNWRLYCSGTPASYTTFGIGCAAASAGCIPKTSHNWTQALATRTTTAKKIAILEVFPNAGASICGVEFRCRARTKATAVTVTVHGVNASTGGVGKALATTTMQVGTQAGVHVAKLASPVKVPSTNMLYFAFDQSDQLFLPITTTGTNGVHVEFDGKSWSSLKNNTPWTYRIDQIDPGKVPQLAANGRPILGKKLDVMLANAAPNSVALFALGSSDRSWGAIPLPFQLTLLNSPGCFLQTSADMILTIAVSSTGTARVPLTIPSNKSLTGLNFYNQFLVVDMKRLALVVSNAGKATIGNF